MPRRDHFDFPAINAKAAEHPWQLAGYFKSKEASG